jgi:hypothetical protein
MTCRRVMGSAPRAHLQPVRAVRDLLKDQDDGPKTDAEPSRL